MRYNLFPAVEVDGDTAPGYSSGQSIAAMEKLAPRAARRLSPPNGPASPISRKMAGNIAGVVFGLAVVFVFLVLAAQYREPEPCRWR